MVVRCRYGKLKFHVKGRTCKLKRKTKLGRKIDRARKSQEPHEIKYRKYK